MISYDWKGANGNKWNVPLGATIGRTFVLGNGHGIDLGLGYYKLIEHPDGAPDSQIKIAITWIPPG